MIVWNDGIYGNDEAQGFLDVLLDLTECCETPDDFLFEAREHPFTEFRCCRLVLADLEADFNGEVRFYRDVLSLIEHELDPSELKTWPSPNARKEALEAFRQSLAERCEGAFHEDNLTPFYQLVEWIEEKKRLI